MRGGGTISSNAAAVLEKCSGDLCLGTDLALIDAPPIRDSEVGWEIERVVLVSLVSVSARNWCYSCGRIEGVEKGEIIEIANIHAGSMQVAENMLE